jgi:hypothetical protein
MKELSEGITQLLDTILCHLTSITSILREEASITRCLTLNPDIYRSLITLFEKYQESAVLFVIMRRHTDFFQLLACNSG